MFNNRSLKIQMVKEDKSNPELVTYKRYSNNLIDSDVIVKKITKSAVKIIVVYISADTARRVIILAAKAKFKA